MLWLVENHVYNREQRYGCFMKVIYKHAFRVVFLTLGMFGEHSSKLKCDSWSWTLPRGHVYNRKQKHGNRVELWAACRGMGGARTVCILLEGRHKSCVQLGNSQGTCARSQYFKSLRFQKEMNITSFSVLLRSLYSQFVFDSKPIWWLVFRSFGHAIIMVRGCLTTVKWVTRLSGALSSQGRQT